MTIIIKKYSMKPTSKRQTVTNSQNTIFAIKRFINNILKIAKNLIEKISYIMILLICTSSFATEKNRPNMFGEFNLGIYHKVDYNHYHSYEVNNQEGKLWDHFIKSGQVGAGVSIYNDIIRLKIEYQKFLKMNLDYINSWSLDDYKHRISADLLGLNIMIKVSDFYNILTYIGYGIGMADIQNGNSTIQMVKSEYRSHEILNFSDGIDRKNLYNKFCFSAKYKINDMLDFNIVNYEFIKLGDIESRFKRDTATFTTNIKTHNITSGVTFKFKSPDIFDPYLYKFDL